MVSSIPIKYELRDLFDTFTRTTTAGQNGTGSKGNEGVFNTTTFVCLFGFHGISTLIGYLMPDPFLYK